MTLIVSWVSHDSRGPSSLYLMSDSRISWTNGTTLHKWDHGKKVFAFKNSPDIIGYCGDTLFTTQAISHIVALADAGILFHKTNTADRRFARIKYKIRELLTPYPEVYMRDSFSIIYGTRIASHEFVCFELTWSKTQGWKDDKRSVASFSDKLMVLGSGAAEFERKYIDYQNSEIKRTSRAIFQCFCDALENIKDPECGGAPQLAGLYRIQNGIDFGIILKNKRYISGVPVDNLSNFNQLEWRNELFERFNGEQNKIGKGAQRQPNPFK
jgi:hypothetical protein